MVNETNRGSSLPPPTQRDKKPQKPLPDAKDAKVQKHRPPGRITSSPSSLVGRRSISPTSGKRISATDKLLGGTSKEKNIKDSYNLDESEEKIIEKKPMSPFKIGKRHEGDKSDADAAATLRESFVGDAELSNFERELDARLNAPIGEKEAPTEKRASSTNRKGTKSEKKPKRKSRSLGSTPPTSRNSTSGFQPNKDLGAIQEE